MAYSIRFKKRARQELDECCNTYGESLRAQLCPANPDAMPLPQVTAINEYAAFLEDCLRDGLKIDPPPDFRSSFAFHAMRLGAGDYEDLGSLVLLECQEMLATDRRPDGNEIRRTMDRVRHRMVRKAKREISLDVANEFPNNSSFSPEQTEKTLRDFMAQLSPVEAVVFDQRCLEGRSVQDIAVGTGCSPATIYRQLATVRAKFEDFVASR